MPFLTQCVFCNHQMEAPDRALGSSGHCPKCSNWFTVVPVAGLSQAAPAFAGGAALRPASTGASPAPGTAPRPAPQPAPPTEGPAATALAGLPPLLAQVPEAAAAPAEEGAPAVTPRRIDPVGLLALFLGVAALLSAAVPRSCGAVAPLGVLALLTELAGVLLAAALGRSRLLLSVVGSALGAGVVAAAVLAPGLLGPAYRAYRERDDRGPLVTRAVPLPGSPAGAAPAEADWVDASRAALQQGRLRVQVTGASVGPLAARATSGKKGKPPQAPFLRLRVHQAEAAREFTAGPRNGPAPAGERPHPTLTDSAGKSYALRTGSEGSEGVERSARFPVTVIEEVFVFEAPPPGVGPLRLEVPVVPWGGTGTFRFAIPDAMVRRAGG